MTPLPPEIRAARLAKRRYNAALGKMVGAAYEPVRELADLFGVDDYCTIPTGDPDWVQKARVQAAALVEALFEIEKFHAYPPLPLHDATND